MPKIKNILIFIAIAAALILIYVFFTNSSSSNQANLVSSSPTTTLPSTTGVSTGTPVAADFLALLLSVKTIKLDDSILSNPDFIGLHDSTITLTQDATIGRPNPFARLGTDATTSDAITSTAPPIIPPITPPAKTNTSTSSKTNKTTSVKQ